MQTVGVPAGGSDGQTMLRGQFETATNGSYAWLNDVAAVGVLRRNGMASVMIDMWQVSTGRQDGVNAMCGLLIERVGFSGLGSLLFSKLFTWSIYRSISKDTYFNRKKSHGSRHSIRLKY